MMNEDFQEKRGEKVHTCIEDSLKRLPETGTMIDSSVH